MIDFVGIPQFLSVALWVAMETMYFHIAQIRYSVFMDIFSH